MGLPVSLMGLQGGMGLPVSIEMIRGYVLRKKGGLQGGNGLPVSGWLYRAGIGELPVSEGGCRRLWDCPFQRGGAVGGYGTARFIGGLQGGTGGLPVSHGTFFKKNVLCFEKNSYFAKIRGYFAQHQTFFNPK